MKLNERRKDALAQLEQQLKDNRRPYYGSAETAKMMNLKKINGKYQTDINPKLKQRINDQITTLQERIK